MLLSGSVRSSNPLPRWNPPCGCRSGSPSTPPCLPPSRWGQAEQGAVGRAGEPGQGRARSGARVIAAGEGGGCRAQPDAEAAAAAEQATAGASRPPRQPALRLLLPRLLTRGSECFARPPGVTGSGHLRPASPSGGRCRSARKGRRRGKERARRRRGSAGRGPWRGRDPPAAPWPLGMCGCRHRLSPLSGG